MQKLTFFTDDPEVLDFVYSLGRSRSLVINGLLRECMRECGGYGSTKTIATAAISCQDKPIKESGTFKKIQPEQVESKETTEVVPEIVSEVVAVEPKVESPNEHIKPKVASEGSTETDSYVTSSAPKINNPAMIAKGLAAFSV